MREILFGASISKANFSSSNNNTSTTSLPLSPPLSTSQTPIASPPSFSPDGILEKNRETVNGMQEQHASSQVQKKNSLPPPSPTSPQSPAVGVTNPTPAAGPDGPSNASVPSAWKIVGSPSRLHHAFPQPSNSRRSSNDSHNEDASECAVNPSRTPSLPEEEDSEVGFPSNDTSVDGVRLIGTRRSSEERTATDAQSVNQNQFNRDASAPGFITNSPGHLPERRCSDVGVSTSLGMGTSPNASAKWGSLGFQWTAGPSIWNGNANGNGRSNSTVGGKSPPPADETPAMRSVSFSGIDGQLVGIGSRSRSPIGSSPLVTRSPSVVGSTCLDDEYGQQQQSQYRQARSLSFALGQQEADCFGKSKNSHAQLSNSSPGIPQASLIAGRRSSSSAIAHSLDDSDLYRGGPGYIPEHLSPPSTASSSLRGLENTYRQSLPSMTEETELPQEGHLIYGSMDDHPDASSNSPTNASYAAFTLPKMRSSSAAAYGGMGMENSVSSTNSSSASSPMNHVRATTGYNGLSPQQQPMHTSVTASSSVSSFPYHHRSSLGGIPGLSMAPTVEDSAPSYSAYANIWRDDSTSADMSHQPPPSVTIHLNPHNAPNNQHRRSITTPNEYWPISGMTSTGSSQQAARLSVGMNGNGGPDMYTSQCATSSPEMLERVRIQRRFSLNPGMSGGMINTQGGMGVGGMHVGMGMGGAIGTNTMGGGYGIGMGSTGSYGEYRYLESGQGLGMLNRSVEPEYAHLNQRRHSVAGPTLSFGNPSQSRYLTDALDALHLDDGSMYGSQQQPHHLGFGGTIEESSLDDYFDNDEPRAARVAAATASGNYGGIPVNGLSNANSVLSALGGGGRVPATAGVHGHSHSSCRDVDAHLGKGVPLHAVPHHGPLYIVEFKAGRSDLFYLVPESPSQQVKKGDLVIVEADRGKDLGKVMNDNITPVQVQMLQQQQAEAAAVAEMGVSIMPDGSLPPSRMIPENGAGGGGPPPGVPVKELHPKRIYRLAQPAEVTMLVTKSQDEAKAIMICQTKVRQKNLPMEVVDAEYQWDRRKLTFYFIAERRIDFRELVRDLFKIYKTRIWMCAVNPNVSASNNLAPSVLNK